MTARPRKPKTPATVCPYAGLEVDHTVMLSSPLVDPLHWYEGVVLWRDEAGTEILVQQYGIAGQNPHKQLHNLSDVRVFGTAKYCRAEKDRAAAAVRDAQQLADQVKDMAADLQRKLIGLYEAVALAALKAAGQGGAGDPQDG